MSIAWLVACGGDDDGEETPVPSANAMFEEGTLRIEIELLDTGLLKGHAFGEAVEGWTVSTFRVDATTDDGTAWGVLAPELTGVGTANVEEFFEVVIEELPRGEQVAVEAIATFTNDSGVQVEHRVVDKWPP